MEGLGVTVVLDENLNFTVVGHQQQPHVASKLSKLIAEYPWILPLARQMSHCTLGCRNGFVMQVI
jgi:hypothetical protein